MIIASIAFVTAIIPHFTKNYLPQSQYNLEGIVSIQNKPN